MVDVTLTLFELEVSLEWVASPDIVLIGSDDDNENDFEALASIVRAVIDLEGDNIRVTVPSTEYVRLTVVV
jgi:hypothetical protein